MHSSIAILDFGSQYAQLIARRVRAAHVYCELFPWDTPADKVLAINPRGFILSGGPASVYAEGAPALLPYILESKLPILGLCYGMQLLAHTLGGAVAQRGRARIWARHHRTAASRHHAGCHLHSLDVARRPHHPPAAGLHCAG